MLMRSYVTHVIDVTLKNFGAGSEVRKAGYLNQALVSVSGVYWRNSACGEGKALKDISSQIKLCFWHQVHESNFRV